MARRSAWSLADQCVSSGTSFLLILVVAHTQPLGEVGAFALVFAIYQLLIATSRPLNTDALTVAYSARDTADQRPAIGAATGAALVLGLTLAPLHLAIGLATGDATGRALIAFAVGVPAFLLQDAWRYAFFTGGRPAAALANDVAVGVCLPLFAVFLHRASRGAGSFIMAWALATWVAALLGAFQWRSAPNVRATVAWWRMMSHLSSRMLLENVLCSGAYLVALVGIGLIRGVAAVGQLRTAQIAIALTAPALYTLATVVLAEGPRLRARSAASLSSLVTIAACAAAILPIALGALWWIVPSTLASRIFGPHWAISRSLLPGAACLSAALGLSIVATSALRVIQMPGQALRRRIFATPFTVLAGFGGASLGGPRLAVAGMAIAEGLCGAALLASYRRYRFSHGLAASDAETSGRRAVLGKLEVW